MKQLFKKIIIILLILCLFPCLFIIATQNFQVFSGAVLSLFDKEQDFKIPKGVESYFIKTSDGVSLEVWRDQPKTEVRQKVAILFHGKSTRLPGTYHIQRHFKNLGYTTYSFDYRGYRNSSGWPTETGLYKDTEAIVEHVLKKEKKTKNDVFLIGNSIGSGPAAYAASKYNIKDIIFYAVYRSLPDALNGRPFLKYFKPFLVYKFPVEEYLSNVENLCAVVFHGKRDRVISVDNAKNLKSNLGEGVKLHLVDDAGHNDIFFKTEKNLSRYLRICNII